MKVIVTGIIAILGNCAFALMVDGIQWHVLGGYKLQHPDVYNSTAYDPPKPAHEGVLPPVLRIPPQEGSCIGTAAIQIPSDAGVVMVIVPETISRIDGYSAFVGRYRELDNSYSSGYYSYPKFKFDRINCDIVFLGDCPVIETDTTWDVKYGKYTYRYSVSTYSPYDTNVNNMLKDSTCYIVDGTSGWSGKTELCGGMLKYYAAKVNMEPKNGIIPNPGGIELFCTNSTAVIYYTTDGSEPVPYETDSCRRYVSSISPEHKTTVKALAYVSEYPGTITYSKTFAFGQSSMPIITALENTFNWSGNVVTLSTETEGAEIRFTLDGKEPTEKSPLYTVPFAIDDTTTIKAKAFKEDWFESETATATFTREWYTVETPVIAPCDATFANASQEVTISCTTEGATILYTTDGSDPLAEGREYKRPFTVYKSCVVRAVALKHDWKNSAESTSALTRGEALSEAANFYGYKMETGTDAPWVVDTEMSHDGVSSVRSGGDGSYLQVSVRGAGTLSFWWRAMCEEPGYEYYDYGCVKMGSDIIGRIAGEDTGWEFFSTKVASTAKHVFRWEYHKDDEGTYEPDCIWVDRVQWIPADGSGYTLTTPEPVPYSWLDEYRLGVGTDYETAGNSASGKMQGGKALHVWQDYVAGTDPTNLESRLEANIEMRDGRPFVWWMPNLNEGGANARVYTVWGKTNLTDRVWHSPTNEASRFFKVTVEMP